MEKRDCEIYFFGEKDNVYCIQLMFGDHQIFLPIDMFEPEIPASCVNLNLVYDGCVRFVMKQGFVQIHSIKFSKTSPEHVFVRQIVH